MTERQEIAEGGHLRFEVERLRMMELDGGLIGSLQQYVEELLGHSSGETISGHAAKSGE